MPNIISAGVSEDLLADFQALRETPSMANFTSQEQDRIDKKYPHKTINQLATYICCRNYASLSLELSYLSWAIVNLNPEQGSLLQFFWLNESIKPVQVRQAFSDCEKAQCLPSNCGLCLTDLGIQINFGNREFTISATRVNLLAAFLELLVTHFVGLLDTIENALIGSSEKEIKSLASDLQKRIYEWLKPRLATANLQQRFRYLDHWLDTYQYNTRSKNIINDEVALAFWQQSYAQEGYVKYTSAVDDIVEYKLALDSVEQSYKAQHGISFEEYAEVINEDEQSLFESVYESSADLFSHALFTELTQFPKYLSAKQYSLLMPFIHINQVNTECILTPWRYSVFGQWQSQLIQASRASKGQYSAAPDIQYKQLSDSLMKIKQANKITILAIVAVLYEKRSFACMEVLRGAIDGILDAEQREALTIFLTQSLSQIHGNSDEMAFTKLTQWRLKNPVLNKVFSVAQQALKKNNRAGFVDFDCLDEQEFIHGANRLIALNKMISTVFKQIRLHLKPLKTTQCDSIDEIYLSDLCIFKVEFEKRHKGE